MDLNLSEEEKSFIRNLDRYFQDFGTNCPYGLPHKAVYRMARFSCLPDEAMGTLLSGGYRRYGNTVYTMRCENCRSCVPIRLDPGLFIASRSQKRAVRANTDLAIEPGPLGPDESDIALLQRFFDTRYPGKNNSARDYYSGFFLNSSGFSLALRYYLGNELQGVSIIDLGEKWLNAVYFFFEPSASKRSLGTFNIMTLVDLCRERGIDHLYLGYWIKETRAMNYKSSFRPHFLLGQAGWEMVGG